jgi:hypothetical protein
MAILSVNDFTGYFDLYKPRGGGVTADYIAELEERFMIALLGDELAGEITSELGEDPIPERAQELIDLGLKKYLRGMIWVEIELDSGIKNSGLGVKPNESEASGANTPLIYTDTRYNQAARKGKKIQKYIVENISIYPTFDAQEIKLAYF